MITNKKKNEKTTEIYFDETPAPVVIRTHNTALKRLLAFAEEFPSLCRLTDDDELGYLSFEIDKERFSIRITTPYTEERRALARTKMNEINNREDIG